MVGRVLAEEDVIMPSKSQEREAAWRAKAALNLVETGMRNSRLEDLHAGVFPTSAIGDYSDVKVVTPDGEIPWTQVSRIDDLEMKALMIEVVNRVYTMLTHPEPFSRLLAAGHWDPPALNPGMMDAVARWEARQRGVPEAEIWATWPIDQTRNPPPIRAEQILAAQAARAEAADGEAVLAVAPAPQAPSPPFTFDATPESLRALAQAPIADAAWIAKAREALRLAADGWESAQLQVLDEIEAATDLGDAG